MSHVRIIGQVRELVWVFAVVKQQLLAVEVIDGVCVFVIAQSAPFTAVGPGSGGTHALHMRCTVI